jgi:transcriptional regulator NrdR family protein
MNRLAISVTKADGSKQLFDRQKVIQTCLRMGASYKVALEIVDQLETQIYEGIPTKKNSSSHF